MIGRDIFGADAVRAFVDGELDEVTAARFARAAEDDPELAGALAAERGLRETLAAHFAPVLSEPIPPHLTASIEAARTVVSLDAERMRRSFFNARKMRWAGPAIAAALVLAVLIPRFGDSPTETRDGLTFASNDLAQALDAQLVADQRPGSDTRVMLSFADKTGTLCRGFARADLSGVACRENDGWHLRIQRDGVDVSATDYRQASSVHNAVLVAAQEMAAGPALDAAEERAAKARGWRRR